MSDRPQRRKQSWMRSQSDGFRPIRQVGVSVSIGLPLMVSGMFLFWIGLTAASTLLWILGATLFVAGLLSASSSRVI